MTADADQHEALDYHALFEAAPSPNLILRADPPYIIVAANDAYLAATMTTRERIVGRAIFDAFPDNPNDPDATGVRRVRESIEHVVAHRRPHTMAVQKYDVPRPDGDGFEERYWSPIHVPLFGPDGRVAYVIQRPENVTEFVRLKARAGEQDRRAEELQDRAEQMEAEVFMRGRELARANAALLQQIVERERAEAGRKGAEEFAERLRESEERFRLMADAVPQIIWITDADGRMEFFNRQWTIYTGLDQWPRTANDVTASILHPEDQLATTAAFDAAKRSGGTFAVEHRIRSAAGEYQWFLVRGEPHRDPQTGQIARWYGTSVDIHDRKLAEARQVRLLEAEQAARTEAERAGRMKDEFLATLSHELRTPLNAILGWSQIVRRSIADADTVLEGMATIERNARSQAQIIGDLLDMSRIVSGKVRLEVQQVDLAAVLTEAVATAKPAAEVKGIRIQAMLDPDAGAVSGDPARLQQVMWNLLSNAAKFTPKGGRVQVRLERVDSNVKVEVSDSGEGIRPEFLPHVFDRFRQADATTTRRHGGLGIGLSIVKQLVELHGGSVRVKSAGLGQGAAFTVSLPSTVLHPEADPAVERLHPRASSTTTGLRDKCGRIVGVKVLVVDDDPDSRALIKRLLEDCDAKVITAASAAEALELLRAERPDVLASDIGMPGEDGYSLIRPGEGVGTGRGRTRACDCVDRLRSRRRPREGDERRLPDASRQARRGGRIGRDGGKSGRARTVTVFLSGHH